MLTVDKIKQQTIGGIIVAAIVAIGHLLGWL